MWYSRAVACEEMPYGIFLFLILPMTLSQKNNAAKKILEIPLVLTVAFSLLTSLANPVVAKAEETTPDPAPFAEEVVPIRPAKKTLTVVSTAYSSEAAQTDSTPCIPAMWKFNLCEYFAETGIEDTIAANFLPLGTEVRFPELYGDKIFVVRDRMNAKYNGKSRIDFWKKDRPSAVTFGVKRIKMEVL